MIKPIDDILNQGAFMAIEAGPNILVAPGLGIAVEKGNKIYGEILAYYNKQAFFMDDGSINKETVVNKVANILKLNGYQANGDIETIGGITIYPAEYFCPMNYYNGKTVITKNTRTIHHYAETWHNPAEKMIDGVRRKLYDTRFRDGLIQGIIVFPFRVWNKLINIKEMRKNE